MTRSAWFDARVDALAPARFRDDPDEMRRLRLVMRYCAMLALVPVLLAAGYALSGAPTVSILNLGIVAGVSLVLPIPIWFGVSVSRWCSLQTLVGAPAIAMMAVAEGDPSRALVWLILPVLLTRIVAGPWSGLVGLLYVGATVAAYFLAARHDLLPLPWAPGATDGQRLTDLVAILVCGFTLAAIATSDHDRAVGALHANHEDLQSEVRDHVKTRHQLELAYVDVVETARVAGMAEVATGVIHNVGNALNTVGVTAQVVSSKLADTTFERRLERLAELLEIGGADPGAVTRYVRTLAKGARELREGLAAEIERLRGAVAHVANVISAQQAHARNRGVIDTFRVGDAVEDVARLAKPALARFAVTLLLEGEMDTLITAERHQIVQVLDNVIRNAAEALSVRPEGRCVRVVTTPAADGVRIQVIDNGPGVGAAYRERIFQHGFTLKETGSGFGLHVSAVAARGLGGRLELDPPSQEGASFSLWLPLVPSRPHAVTGHPASRTTTLHDEGTSSHDGHNDIQDAAQGRGGAFGA